MTRYWFALVAAAAMMCALGVSPAAAADAGSGEDTYMFMGCWTCHGTVGQGARGPAIAPGPLPFEAFAAYVRQPPGEMPPFREAILSEAMLQDIHAYLAAIPAAPDVGDTILAGE